MLTHKPYKYKLVWKKIGDEYYVGFYGPKTSDILPGDFDTIALVIGFRYISYTQKILKSKEISEISHFPSPRSESSRNNPWNIPLIHHNIDLHCCYCEPLFSSSDNKNIMNYDLLMI